MSRVSRDKYHPNEGKDLVDDVLQRNAHLERRISDLERALANQDTPPPIPRLDPLTYPEPYEGQRAIDITDEQHMWYSDGEWRKAGGGMAVYEIKIFEDINVVFVGDDAFIWEIPEELDNSEIIAVEAFITTVSSSGPVQIQIRHQPGGSGSASDILSTKITIDAGEKNSKDATNQPVISGGTWLVNWGDHLYCDIDAAGVGAKGLGLIVTLTPSPLGSVAIVGNPGPPGGITDWEGQWQGDGASSWTTATGYTTGQVVVHGGTFYVASANHTSGTSTEPGVGGSWQTVWNVLSYTQGQAVTNNGSSYVAIVNHTATTASEPGVGANWEDFWMLLAGSQQISSLNHFVNGNNYPLDVGAKGWIHVPFACTITEMTLLADRVGNLVVDIWKDNYGVYPPTSGDSICAAAKPTLSGALKTTDTTLTGWTTSVAAGDVLKFNIDSVSVITAFTIALKVLRV